MLLAWALAAMTQGLPAWAALTVLLMVTMTLPDVPNNTATTIVAASSASLTPIGHENNALILGPGGYWCMGLPLKVIVFSVAIPSTQLG